LPELFRAPTCDKTQGRGQGGSAANFYWAPKHRRSFLVRPEAESPRRPTARPMPAGGGERSPQVLPELFGAPSGRKTQGRCQGGSPADFLLGPQASTELVSPPEGQIKGSTGRSGSAADLLQDPQASTGSTGGKLQGKTGQGVSAANFFPGLSNVQQGPAGCPVQLGGRVRPTETRQGGRQSL